MKTILLRRIVAHISLVGFVSFLHLPLLSPVVQAQNDSIPQEELSPAEAVAAKKDALIDELFFTDNTGDMQRFHPSIAQGSDMELTGTPYSLALRDGVMDLGFENKALSITPHALLGSLDFSQPQATDALYLEGPDGTGGLWNNSSIIYKDAYGEGIHYGVVAKNEEVRKVVRFDTVPDSPTSTIRVPFGLSVEDGTEVTIGDMRWGGGTVRTRGTITLHFPDGSSASVQPAYVWDSGTKKEQIALELSTGDNGEIVLIKLIPRSFFHGASLPVFTDAVIAMAGSRATVSSPRDAYYIDVAALSSTKFVMVYTKSYASGGHNNGSGMAVIGDVSGNDITLGSEYQFANNATTTRVDALSSSKIVVGYSNAADGGSGMTIIGDVSGTAITFGTAQVVPGYQDYGSNVGKALDVSAMDSSTYVVGFYDSTFTSCSSLRATVSGTTSTFDSDPSNIDSNVCNFIAVTAIDSSRFVAIYSDTSETDVSVIAGEHGGSTFAFGSIVDVFTSSEAVEETNNYHGYPVAIDDLSSSKVIGMFRPDGGTVAQRRGQIFAADIDSSEEVTAGSNVNFASSGFTNRQAVGVAALSASQAVGVIDGQAAASQVRVADISGTTVTLGAKRKIDTLVNNVSVAALSSTQVAIGYQFDPVGGGSGTVSIGNVGSNPVLRSLQSNRTAVLSSDNTTDVSSNGQTGSTGIRVKHDGECAVDATFDFDSGEEDVANWVVTRDDSSFATLVHNITGHTGISGNLTMYTKKSASHDNFRYCSGKTTIGCTESDSWSVLWDDNGDVVSTNGGFDDSPYTLTVESVCGETVWKLVGPIASGGQGEGGTDVPEFSTWALLVLLIGCGYVLHRQQMFA